VKSGRKPATEALLAWRGGSGESLDELVSLVYDELCRLAIRAMSDERSDHTYSAAGLVHEAFIRLVDSTVSWQDRAHFFAVAARVMRYVLVERLRLREETAAPVSSTIDPDEPLYVAPERLPAVANLDQALGSIASEEPRASQVLELHYFGGLTPDEIAEALDISLVTVHRDLRMAKARLRENLRQGDVEA